MRIMRLQALILTGLLLLLQSFLFAQDDLRDLNNAADTGADLLARPFHFDGTDAARLAGVAGITAISSFLDDDLQMLTQNNKSEILDFVFAMDKYYLEAFTALSAGLYIYGLAAEQPRTRRLGLNLLESTVFSTLITNGVKVAFGRTRPTFTTDPQEINPVQFSWAQTSFPSGHATFAFSFARVMAEEKSSTLWKAGWYAFAVLGSFARVYNNHHWFSDVVLGSFIGYFVGDFVVKQNHPSKYEPVVPPPPVLHISYAF